MLNEQKLFFNIWGVAVLNISMYDDIWGIHSQVTLKESQGVKQKHETRVFLKFGIGLILWEKYQGMLVSSSLYRPPPPPMLWLKKFDGDNRI